MTTDNKLMKKALHQAQQAFSSGEFPVGCVLAHHGQVLTTGSRTGTAAGSANEVDHAEMVALRRLSALNGNINPAEISLYCTMEPCLMCFSAIMLAGIGRVVFAYEDVMGGGTGIDRSALAPLYRDRTVRVVPNVMRDESLRLFQAFFKNPDNDYWRGSLLAEYTLSQSLQAPESAM